MEDLNNNEGAYSAQNKSDLEKLKSIRMSAIDAMIKDGMPVKVAEIRVLNELISSGEKSIHDTVANQLKYQDNNNKDDLNKLVAAVLLNSKNKQDSSERRLGEPVLAEDQVINDILDTELNQGYEELDSSDFIGGANDN